MTKPQLQQQKVTYFKLKKPFISCKAEHLAKSIKKDASFAMVISKVLRDKLNAKRCVSESAFCCLTKGIDLIASDFE